jgi:ech hydrogenase subunit A
MSDLLANLAILLLIVVPVIGGLACLPLRKLPMIGKVVGFTAAVLTASVALLLYQVLSDGPVTVPAGDLSVAGTAIMGLDILLIGAFIYIAWKAKSPLAGSFAAIQLIVLAVLELNLHGEQGAAIYVDQLSVMVAFITSVLGSIICIYAVKYMEHYKDHRRFFAVMLLFLGAMNGAVFSNSLLWLFFFWEVTTLCSYLLIGHTGTVQAKASALTAAVYTLGGGVALIIGIALCYHYFDTTFLDQMPLGSAIGGLSLLPLALMAVAAFTKSAQLPFQKWLLGAMVAPTPVSALLHSATMVNLGVYLLLRLAPNLNGTGYLVGLIGAVGAISFLATAVLAITQSNAKRVLAYSTIGNLGLIVVCVGLDTSLALTAGLLLLIFHAISKALLFLSVGVVKEQLGSEDIDDMEGLRDILPAAAVGIFIGVFMMILPPFGMFASKWVLSEAASSSPAVAVLLVLGFGATMVYYAKWLGGVFTGDSGRTPLGWGKVPRAYLATLGAVSLIGLVATALIGAIVDRLVNPYVSVTFGTTLSAGPLGLESPYGLLPTILLLALAAILVVMMVLPRKGKERSKSVYTCGEGCGVQTGSFYYWSEARVTRVTHGTNMVMAFLLLALVAAPALLEVIG